MAAAEPRRTPLSRSLHRPDLLAGCERELLLGAGLIAGVLIVVALNWVAFTVGLTLWVAVVAGLRHMGKTDPIMSRVYLRAVRYRHYYPARSTPFARSACAPR